MTRLPTGLWINNIPVRCSCTEKLTQSATYTKKAGYMLVFFISALTTIISLLITRPLTPLVSRLLSLELLFELKIVPSPTKNQQPAPFQDCAARHGQLNHVSALEQPFHNFHTIP